MKQENIDKILSFFAEYYSKNDLKPGYRTTEFYIMSGLMIVSLFLVSGVVSGHIVVQIFGGLSMILSPLSYLLSRTSLKKKYKITIDTHKNND